MRVDYKKIQPPGYLKNHVRYFWTLEDCGSDSDPKTFRILADGCPGLFFNQSEKSVIYQNNEKLLPAIFLYGQATKYSELKLTESPNIIGACFYPNALKLIFGFDADELTDSCTDLNEISEKQGFYLSEKLSRGGPKNQIEIISSFLWLQIQKNNFAKDNTIQYAISRIIESNGNIPLSQLQKDLRLSERSLERKFKQNVGISPKLFSRIWRFQASLGQLRRNGYLKLSDIAYDNDYADQSHFIRAFREFAGFSPNQFQKLSNAFAENFSELKN